MWVVLPSTFSSELKRRDVPNCTEEGLKGRMATWGERRCAVEHLASNGLQSGAVADLESLFTRFRLDHRNTGSRRCPRTGKSMVGWIDF